MKKVFAMILILTLLFMFVGCGSQKNDIQPQSATPASESTPASTPESTPESTTEQTNTTDSLLFCYLSGVGAWASEMTVNKDGSFTGTYYDAETDTGEDYPNGTELVCKFSGKFTNIEKVNDYTYSLTLEDLQTEKEPGEEWIEDGVRYIATSAPGFINREGERCTEYLLYTPDTPISELSEEFLSWCHLGDKNRQTLSCYGICNVETDDGYFSEAVSNQQPATQTPESTPESTPASTPESTPAPDSVAVDSLDFLPLEFHWTPGVGANSSTMTVNKDGSFTGVSIDAEAGSYGDDYPNGTNYICNFSGKFTNLKKINDYTYSLTLTEVKTEKEPGEEWIEDGVRYIATNASGLVNKGKVCTEYLLYTPDAPTSELSEDFLWWWPLKGEWPQKLSCYGIRNVETDDGYFTEK